MGAQILNMLEKKGCVPFFLSIQDSGGSVDKWFCSYVIDHCRF